MAGSPLVKARLFGHIPVMTLCLIVLGSLLLALPSKADQVKLDSLVVGSMIYSNVTVLGSNATDLYFKHSQGIANVKLKYLSPELQKRFGYDPAAAVEAEQKQAQEDTRYNDSLALKPVGRRERDETEKKPRTSETSITDPISERSLLGKSAPALEVEKWLSEKPVLEGKFVLVSFWAPWSVPCRKAIPELNTLQKKFAEKLVVVGVSAEPEEELAQMPEPKLEFACAVDAKAKLSAAADVTSIPYVLLVDPKGIVRYQGHPGAITEARLSKLISSEK